MNFIRQGFSRCSVCEKLAVSPSCPCLWPWPCHAMPKMSSLLTNAPSRALRTSSCTMFDPMKTISLRLSPWGRALNLSARSGHFSSGADAMSQRGPGFSSADSPAELHSTAFSLFPALQTKPFERKTPGKEKLANIFVKRSGWKGRSAR